MHTNSDDDPEHHAPELPMNPVLRWQRTRIWDYVQNFDYTAIVDGVPVARVRHSSLHSIKGFWQVFIDDGAPVMECTTRLKAMKVAENLVGKLHRLSRQCHSEFPNQESSVTSAITVE